LKYDGSHRVIELAAQRGDQAHRRSCECAYVSQLLESSNVSAGRSSECYIGDGHAYPQTDQRGGQYVRGDRNARGDHRDRCGMAVR
jgi:hypothetical protein